jgi:hypothetical protein
MNAICAPRAASVPRRDLRLKTFCVYAIRAFRVYLHMYMRSVDVCEWRYRAFGKMRNDAENAAHAVPEIRRETGVTCGRPGGLESQ